MVLDKIKGARWVGGSVGHMTCNRVEGRADRSVPSTRFGDSEGDRLGWGGQQALDEKAKSAPTGVSAESGDD